MLFLNKLFLAIKTSKQALISSMALLFFLLLALLADLIAPYSFAEPHPEFLNIPPLWMKGGVASFPLGTDDIGRDFLSRLIHGARFSIGLGLMATLLSVPVGASIGLLAGWSGGALDRAVVSAVDVMMSFPGILLAIVIVAILGPGLFNTVIAVHIMAWPAMIRVVRGETLKEKNKEYVLAIKGMGAGSFRATIKHILPNISAPLIVQSVLSFSEAILNISALGFLGLGARPPLPEWGTMISDGREFMNSSWWLVLFPGVCMLIVVLCVNIFGNALRDALDPKS